MPTHRDTSHEISPPHANVPPPNALKTAAAAGISPLAARVIVFRRDSRGTHMFGIDLVALVTAAIAGAIGGLIGALIARQVPEARANLRIAIIVAGVVVLPVLARPFLAPQVEQVAGSWLRTSQFDTLYDTEVLAELKKMPAYERIFREHPEIEKKFRAAARKAYQAGGAKALLQRAPAIGAEVLSDSLMLYLPRARGEDLILFARTMAQIVSAMNERDPELCIIYQFGTQFGQPLDNARLEAVIGRDSQTTMLDAMNKVVSNAASQPVPFDRTRAEGDVADLAERHAPLLTGNAAEVAAGTRLHKDKAEAQAACSFAAAMFKDLSTMDPAIAERIMRQLYAPPPVENPGR